jgi:lysozyme
VSLKPAAQELSISPAGVSLVASFEGFSSHVYRDAIGVPTIGFGHTGPDVWRLDPLSHAAGVRLLHRDLDHFAVAVSGGLHSPTSRPQYSAMVSFSYNVGAGAFRSSTLLRLHNARNYRAAADQFLRWDKAGGHVLLGLHRRRVAERSMYLSGTR